jgi:hypothetical protein
MDTNLATVAGDTTSIDGKLGTLGQKAMAGSAPVVIASDQSAIPVTSALDVIDFLDTDPVLDTSSTSIPASGAAGGAAALPVVASLAGAVSKVYVADTTGSFIGVYNKAVPTTLVDGLEFIINPGMDTDIEIQLASTSGVWIRHMSNTAVSVGDLMMQFIG